MTEEEHRATELKTRRRLLNDQIELYLKAAGVLESGELPTNWVILVPTVGVDVDNDETSYVYRIFRDGSMPSWMLMGILEHERTTNTALVMAREWHMNDSQGEEENSE